MINYEQMASVLEALPDPAFILSSSGKYVAVFGGRDKRYYHDGSCLVGKYIPDLIKTEKANWFLEQIELALSERRLIVEEYELSNKDVKGLPDEGPEEAIWFEGRIQALDFLVDGEPVVLWVASNISARHELEVRLRDQSYTDELTGLFNRRKLEFELSRHFETFRRHMVPTSLLILDLDNLKAINDSEGHHVGDQVILAAAGICRAELRKTDIACRFGGDEFVIVLPHADLDHALQFAKRLNHIFKNNTNGIPVCGNNTSVSIGVATIFPEDCSYEDTLRRADRALYEAKAKGKDEVVSS